MSKNEYAAYYTPKSVADAIAYWGIQSSDDLIFDPSYGGCSFLYAATERLGELGAKNPGQNVYGVDVDPNALKYLDKLYEYGAKTEQFIHQDFFDVDIDTFQGNKVDVILGNPPYIRYHSLHSQQKEKAIARLKAMGMSISGLSSYWAYFLLYSLKFLKVGGRLAMILPGAFLHTSYAEKVRNYLTQYFACVDIFLLAERIFENTDEESIIVCASGAWQQHSSLRIQAVENINELNVSLRGNRTVDTPPHILEGDGSWLRALLSSREIYVYEQLIKSKSVIRVGDYIDSKLGVVTGRNKYFILSQEEKAKRQLPDDIFVPIINKATKAKRLILTDHTLADEIHTSTRSLLLKLSEEDIAHNKIKKYLKYGEKIGVPNATQCRSRRFWWQVPLTYTCDAMMPIMSAGWTHIIVNQSSYTCTNNILRLSWVDENQTDLTWLQVAIGSVSSFTQLSSELVGRSYGGGILKLEPQELANLAIPILPNNVCEKIASEVDDYLANGQIARASQVVDIALVENLKDFTDEFIQVIHSARNLLFKRRRHNKNDVAKYLGE